MKDLIQNRIGFMQGRLSPMVDGRIQAFPKDHWRRELRDAGQIGLALMEWTLDQEGLRENPLLSSAGRAEIQRLSSGFGVIVPSVTGDCFMQAPFYKLPQARESLLYDLEAIIQACGSLSIKYIVFPLVDAGRLETPDQVKDLRAGLAGVEPLLRRLEVGIVFESDYGPQELARFIEEFPDDCFGINYDIGNSASFGFRPEEELGAYGERVRNVHVKDRLLGGTTVPLGCGAADFETVFSALLKLCYSGNFILQTARASDDDHLGAIRRYLDFTLQFLTRKA